MRGPWDFADDTYLRMSGSAPDPDAAHAEWLELREQVARDAPASSTQAEIDAAVRQLSCGRVFTAPPGEGIHSEPGNRGVDRGDERRGAAGPHEHPSSEPSAAPAANEVTMPTFQNGRSRVGGSQT